MYFSSNNSKSAAIYNHGISFKNDYSTRRSLRFISFFIAVLLLFFLSPGITFADSENAADPDIISNSAKNESIRLRLAAGFQHSAMIDYDGRLFVWGDNSYGQLGIADEAYVDAPTELKLPEPVKEISLGAWHTLLLTESGKVYSMGRNTFGQLGSGTFENSSTPQLLKGLPVISKIAAGSYHSLALTESGEVWGWGNNTTYQLAQAESDELQQDDGQIVARRTPVPRQIIDGSIVDIAAGGHFSLCLDNRGKVKSWGDNSKGQLGIGTDQIQQFPQEIGDLENISAIYAGYEYALAISNLEDRDLLFAWGDHALGQLGASDLPGSGTSRLRPVRVDLTDDQIEENDRLLSISAGYAHVIATVPETVTASAGDTGEEIAVNTGRQKLLVWGSNAYGQLGLGSYKSQYKPTELAGEFDGFSGSSFLPFDAVAAGGSHSLVMSSKGQLAASGQGSRGQLGTVSIIDRDIFTLVETSDLILPGWSDGQTLSAIFNEQEELEISWPSAQDNLLVAGYKIVIQSETGQTQILEAGDKTERIVKNLKSDEAYAIAVYVYDKANADLNMQDLSVLYGAYLPEAFPADKWSDSFSQPINGISNASQVLNHWNPDITGQRQPLEVPWSQLSVYGEKLKLPSEPFPIFKVIIMAVSTLLIVSIAILTGINFHKKRYILYPIPKLSDDFRTKVKNKLLPLSRIRSYAAGIPVRLKQTISDILKKDK